MNALAIATVVATPDGTGHGQVSYAGQQRLCWFDATRFSGSNAPAVNDRVVIAAGPATLMAVALIGVGDPTG